MSLPVHSYLSGSRFHARMKICLQKGTKGAPFHERTIDTIVLNRDFGIPVCSIEKEYVNAASGQLRTRFQAFIESVEIKKIQEGARK